ARAHQRGAQPHDLGGEGGGRARICDGGTGAARHRRRRALRLLHAGGDYRAGRPRLLFQGRGRAICRERTNRAGRRTADQYSRGPAVALSSGTSGVDVFDHRSGAAVARRVRTAPGRGREDRVGTCTGRNHVNTLHGDFRERAGLMAAETAKALPAPTLETRPYWEGCKRHELRIQRCGGCGRYQFYPRIYCAQCFDDRVEWVTASGRATVLSFTIVRRPVSPAFAADV